jgi:hypothetical protein
MPQSTTLPCSLAQMNTKFFVHSTEITYLNTERNKKITLGSNKTKINFIKTAPELREAVVVRCA